MTGPSSQPGESPDWDPPSPMSGIVLAGGRNSRMGGLDKAFLSVGGEPAIDRIVRLFRRCFREVIVVTNSPEKYAGMDVAVAIDEYPHRGPLAGIHAGLGASRYPYAFISACDMPFLRREPISLLIERTHDQDVVVPRWEGDIEPLHAVYATRLRVAMGAALDRGIGSVRDFLPLVDVDYVDEDVMRSVSGAEESFRNLNTPEDAARFAVSILR